MFLPTRIYAFDTETDNSKGFGLNPPKSRFTDISLATADGPLVFSDGDEALMLKRFDTALYDLPPGLIATWNGTHFDLPFLKARLAANGMGFHSFVFQDTPMFPPKYQLLPGRECGLTASVVCKLGAHAHLDIAYAYKRIAGEMGVEWGLKPVAEALGLPIVEGVDRASLHLLSDAERTAYSARDAELTRELALRLLGADAAPGR